MIDACKVALAHYIQHVQTTLYIYSLARHDVNFI